jgi:Heterokaryon incompatibility protein (HET)
MFCIYQGCEDEKSKQIPLMGEIFTWAATVYVWLGTGTPESDDVMECIKLCSRENFSFYSTQLLGATRYTRQAARAVLWRDLRHYLRCFSGTFVGEMLYCDNNLNSCLC